MKSPDGEVKMSKDGELCFFPEDLDTDVTSLTKVTEITIGGETYIIAVPENTELFFLKKQGDQVEFADSDQIESLENITAN